ncbi:MAG TPA: site-specific integrase [Candidatus Fimousia stercorigallinarum]|nr:site-specific integrase [Candidatus Fimousia stercorigallinarum]
MPTYKDKKTGLWFCKFYYTDYTGKRKQKKKMGFKLQREAKEWEQNFLQSKQGSMDMTVQAFADIYLEDMSNRLKEISVKSMKNRIDNYVLPYFGNTPMNEVTPVMVRNWQNDISKADVKRGTGKLKPTSLRLIDSTLTGLFSYAVNYYGLSSNPCKQAGNIGSLKPEKVQFWTLKEFKKFISCIPAEDITNITIFTTLFYTGIRVSELLALTPADIDITNHHISITKNYHRMNRRDVITPPKTKKSIRSISIPPFLVKLLKSYMGHLYEPDQDQRIFTCTNRTILNYLKKYADLAGNKQIKVHDLRHSHASMLIEMGFSPLMIAERLGHEDVSTTLNRYSHLYPSKQQEVSTKLEENKIIVPF